MKETSPQPPFEQFYDLNRLSDAGYETILTLDEAGRARVAAWLDVPSLDRFEAKIALKRLSPGRFAYEAEIDAAITQDCTVTLEPVSSHIVKTFSRTLHLVSKAPSQQRFTLEGELSAASGDDDVPEDIDNSHFDLAAPVLEELVLAIDPYPRAPGVAFAPPADEDDEKPNPFAVLKSLKQ
jgi:uncharacterized metal-binding protein YceD (DUF177 family)